MKRHSDHSHNSSSYNIYNTDDNNINNKESKGKKARSDCIDYENMRGSNIQKRLDPATSFNFEACWIFHTSPDKNNKLKLEVAEPIFGNISIKKKKLGAKIIHDNCAVDASTSNNIWNNRRAASYQSSKCCEGEELQGAESTSLKVNMVEGGIVCSMCGDVGIAELLFLCSKCSRRNQHIYCGRSYPYLCEEAAICNWCLHEQDSLTSSAEKTSMIFDDTNAHTQAGEANDTNVQANGNATHPIEELNNPGPVHVHEEYRSDEALVKIKGHGKAFEYLLLIAAQCLPQVISEGNDETQQANQIASMIDITTPKMGNPSDSKANSDADRKAKLMGSTDSNKIVRSLQNQARISNDRERLTTGLDSRERMELQNAVDMNVEEKMDHGGVCAGGNTLKYGQRCSKGIDAALAFKCRKRGLRLSPGRSNYRRYKLLADVVC